MTVIERNTPSSSELLEYVPSSTYVKNQMSNNRRIVKISPDNNNLRGPVYPSNAIANFTIPYSTNTLLNLSECYFDVSGTIIPKLNGADVANDTAIGTFKAGPFWLLPTIQRATMQIGTEVVYDVLLPFRTAKFKEMMYYNYNDKQNQVLEYQNIPRVDTEFSYLTLYPANFAANPSLEQFNAYLATFNATISLWGEAAVANATGVAHNANVNTVIAAMNGKLTALQAKIPGYAASALSTLTDDGNATTTAEMNKLISEVNYNYMIINGLDAWKVKEMDLFGYTNIKLTPTFQVFTEGNKKKIAFQQYLKLSDIFPCENMKPIFGQSVQITLSFESDGFNGIAVDKNAAYDAFLIQYFTQFNFNSITYNLNVDMQAKLSQIYSKPILEVIDDIKTWDGPMQQAKANSTIQLKVPMDVSFETDMVAIIIPQSVSDTLQLKQTFETAYANTTRHTIMDYRFVNYTRLDVYADSDLIYTHNYADTKVYKNSSIVIDAIASTRTALNTYAPIDINNFVPAYHLYKECRWCCGSDEEGAFPLNEFLTTGFMICIPMSAFSRISTSAQLQINLTFGEGVNEGQANYPSMIQIVKDSAELLNNVRVIIKSKKGLLFNGINSCKLKQITQSFDQEIEIEAKTQA